MSDYGAPPPPPPYGGPPYGGPPYGGPPPMGPPAGGPPPANNLVWAIVSLLCCWPLGIPAIVFAAQVNTKWSQGDVVGATESARKARQFALWATIAGVVIIVIDVVVFVLIGVNSTSSTN